MIPPKPGTIGLSKIDGWVGRFINFGQAITGDASGWSHAFLVVDEHRVIQAMPGGAEWASLDWYMEPGHAVFLPGWPDLSDTQRAFIPEVAEALIGTPYSFADYLWLAALALKIPASFTKRLVTNSGHMICSQLVDELLRRVGAPLFDDGRLPQDVTPGDIHQRWTEALSQASLEYGFPPVPATADPEDVHPLDPQEAS